MFTLILVPVGLTVVGTCAWKTLNGLYNVLQPTRCGYCSEPIAHHVNQQPC